MTQESTGDNGWSRQDFRSRGPQARRRSAEQVDPAKAGSAPAAIPRAASASSSSTTARRSANMQIIADGHAAELRDARSSISRPGCSVTVEGEVKASAGKGQATEVAGRGASSSTAGPIPRNIRCRRSGTRSSFCATIAHLRPRTNTFGAIARVRNCVCRSIHEFFQEEGFLYIHTPIITASDCEGAGAMFQVTTLDLAKLPKTDGKVDYTQDFFDRPAYLTVSGQLEGRDLRLLRWARSTRSARRSAPRTPTRRGTWPSSGWSSRRWPSTS